jgi:RHS repeat-associated protein
MGIRTRVIEVSGDRVSWSYDSIYQLTREWRGGVNSYAVTYTYDSVGNRLSKKDGGLPTTYSYDAGNQIRRYQDSTGYTSYTYDGAGNLSATKSANNQRTTYSWDAEQRLTKVSLPTGTIDTFIYNAHGQRVQNQDSAGTTKLVWDSQNILAETDTNNAVKAVYSLEPVIYGNLISVRRGATTSFYQFDGLGSTDCLTSSGGTVTDTYLYQAFGRILLSSGTTTNPYTYLGRAEYYYNQDIAGYYVRAREYDHASGRFISRDPARFGIAVNEYRKLDMLNLYRYVYNSPIVLFDPSGLQSPGQIVVIAGTIAASDGPLPIGDAVAAGLLCWALGVYLCYGPSTTCQIPPPPLPLPCDCWCPIPGDPSRRQRWGSVDRATCIKLGCRCFEDGPLRMNPI